MKSIFYLSLFLFTNVILFAQTPGGVAGSVLWLKGNAGASTSAWTDNSGSANNFSAPLGNEPVLNNNIFNFNAALGFNGVTTFMSNAAPTGFPGLASERTMFVVASLGDLTSFKWILAYGTRGFPPGGGTFQMGQHGGKLTNAFYGSPADLESPGNYWGAAQNTNGALAAYTISGSTETQYDRGVSINSATISTLLTATSIDAIIGSLDATPLVSQEVWSGSIGEIILFPSALTDADRNKVESYLALKYGFTLGTTASPLNYTASNGTVYWTGAATYQNDIFGIGTDATGTALTQLQSNSMNSGSGAGIGQSGKGNLVLSTGTALSDNQFLMVGNDAGALTEHLIVAGEAPAVAEGSQRLVRNWKAQNTGSAGVADLSFDVTGLTLTGGATSSNYRLMIDNDGDGNYTTGTQTFVKPTSFSGNLLNFTGLTLNNSVVFTIITQATALLPAIWQGFTVTLQKNKATLTWKTSDEINVDHYTAEYAANGINFIPVGTVAAKNGTGINTYSLTQENLPAGIRYYRIKRVDKDGKSELSQIKSVRAGGLTSVILKSNPLIKGRLELNIDVPQNQDAVIRVVSTAGHVLVQQNTSLSTGTNAITTNISHIATGTYFLQVQLADEIINKKFIKL
ncbi:MAG TPA: T9SS type A sorting domain-containing protein [Chitinophagaceae bacterium]|nr:T9SS type A sorting domain-containing protein [Chitinophagaceae bacterium]